jgi:hypothetical protein
VLVLAEEQVEALRRRNEALEEELRRIKRKPEGRIGYALLALGLALLALAIIYSHNVASFISIALTFWGALLLYVRPTEFVRKEVLGSLVDYNENLVRIADDLDYTGTPLYISPGSLWGLSNTVLWVPRNDTRQIPSDDELSSQRAVLEDPPGLVFKPQGQDLSRLLEEELGTSFARVDMDYLRFNLEKALVEGLEIAEGFTIEQENRRVKATVKGSIFNKAMQGGARLSDPLSSAVASILARTTRRPVEILSVEASDDEIVTTYRIHNEGEQAV